ncbi:hypothetical protein BELL_0539g00010 [Botrytis elliptica]|uniref:Uncharacterized protein n=1 Tax=Botrytis elliptica TaxID=278938 RepID=A0A4Z1JDR2_9HELO|nr:hypothetical protein EAE99_003188 [Botrytis elliptica]TGO71708.1 hypothetical protein BELL_0539g00010 [Botrytis elliptica]
MANILPHASGGHLNIGLTIGANLILLHLAISTLATDPIVEIFCVPMVQTRLRRDEPIPVHQHTSTAAPNTSSAVSVANFAFTVLPADSIDSVVSVSSKTLWPALGQKEKE